MPPKAGGKKKSKAAKSVTNKRRRGFIFEEQNFGILDMLVRVNMTGGSLFNCNGRSWDVDISDGF